MVNFLNFEYVLTIHKAGTIRAAADELYMRFPATLTW